jgi:hypothetical protein
MQDKVRFSTGTFELKDFMWTYIRSITALEIAEREDSLRKLWRSLGFDTMNLIASGAYLGSNLINIKVVSYQIIRANSYRELETS